MKFKISPPYLAVFTLFGTIVGAGIFALPYMFVKAGLWPSLFFFLLVSALAVLLHLMYGEVVLRTPGIHRLTGYTKIYLGKFWQIIAAINDIGGGFLILLVYLILGSKFLLLLFPGLGSSMAMGVFWFLFSLILIKGLRLVGETELLLNAVLIIVLLIMIFLGIPSWSLVNIPGFDGNLSALLPYGILIFTLTGALAIPEIRDFLKGREYKLRRMIIIGTLLAAVISFIFGFGIAGITGVLTSEDALSGLGMVLGLWSIKLGALVGLIAIATSYIISGLYIRDVLVFDFSWSRFAGTIFTILLPPVLFWLGLHSFISLIGFVGSVSVGLAFIITILLYRAARQKGTRYPEYKITLSQWFLWILMILFALGAVLETIF